MYNLQRRRSSQQQKGPALINCTGPITLRMRQVYHRHVTVGRRCDGRRFQRGARRPAQQLRPAQQKARCTEDRAKSKDLLSRQNRLLTRSIPRSQPGKQGKVPAQSPPATGAKAGPRGQRGTPHAQYVPYFKGLETPAPAAPEEGAPIFVPIRIFLSGRGRAYTGSRYVHFCTFAAERNQCSATCAA